MFFVNQAVDGVWDRPDSAMLTQLGLQRFIAKSGNGSLLRKYPHVLLLQNGNWDIQDRDPEVYVRALPMIIRRLGQLLPQTQLVFLSTATFQRPPSGTYQDLRKTRIPNGHRHWPDSSLFDQSKLVDDHEPTFRTAHRLLRLYNGIQSVLEASDVPFINAMSGMFAAVRCSKDGRHFSVEHYADWLNVILNNLISSGVLLASHSK